jgi:K+-transporting ATPase ATPase C chain
MSLQHMNRQLSLHIMVPNLTGNWRAQLQYQGGGYQDDIVSPCNADIKVGKPSQRGTIMSFLRPAQPSTSESRSSRLSVLSPELGPEIRQLLQVSLRAVRMLLILTILSGVLFPLALFGLGQALFPSQANGSLITNRHGQSIGSSLIGQQFTSLGYFQGRPSAVSYNAAGSGGSAIGPTNPQLLTGNGTEVTVAPGQAPPVGSTPVPGKPNTYFVPGSYLGVITYARLFRMENGLPPDMPLPADIVTASGSGLDPDISPAAALLQVNRIVAFRKKLGGKNSAITVDGVNALINREIEWPQLGFLGEPRVNVLDLNRALDAQYGPLQSK